MALVMQRLRYRHLLILVTVVTACAPPNQRPIDFERWVAENITYVDVAAEAWALADPGMSCADASPTHPMIVLRNAGCAPLRYRDLHEAAHHWAHAHDFYVALPGDKPCTFGFGGCPPGERAAEAVTDALGYERPAWWGVGYEHLGYGSATPENVARARTLLAQNGILVGV